MVEWAVKNSQQVNIEYIYRVTKIVFIIIISVAGEDRKFHLLSDCQITVCDDNFGL